MKRLYSDDGGLSLIELIVVVVLLGILGGATAIIFANSWKAQDDVTSMTEATNQGQLVGQSIERAVRNGIAIKTDAAGSVLTVRTVYTDNRQCQTFWIDSGKLYMASRTTGGPPPVQPWSLNVVKVNAITNFFVITNNTTVGYSMRLRTNAAPVTIAGNVSLRVGGAPWSAGDTAICG